MNTELRCPNCGEREDPCMFDLDIIDKEVEITCQKCGQRYLAGVVDVQYYYETEKLPPLACEICGREYDYWGKKITLKYNEKTGKHVCKHCADLIDNQLDLFRSNKAVERK